MNKNKEDLIGVIGIVAVIIFVILLTLRLFKVI